jgi:hypothetical protein
MKWCCDSAKNRFESRHSYGEFLVAGIYPEVGKVWFFAGFNMAHRRDYSDVLSATKAASEVIKAIGISNFKLAEHHCVHFCSHCGAKLSEFYGSEGGYLRDDNYVKEMTGNTQQGGGEERR